MDKVKSKFFESLTLVFFSACDLERDNYIDRANLRKIVTLGLSKEEAELIKRDPQYLDSKVEDIVKMIGPAKPDLIRE